MDDLDSLSGRAAYAKAKSHQQVALRIKVKTDDLSFVLFKNVYILACLGVPEYRGVVCGAYPRFKQGN